MLSNIKLIVLYKQGIKMKKPALFIGLLFLSTHVIFSQGRRNLPPNPPASIIEKSSSADAGGTPGLALDVRLGGGIGIPIGALSAVGSDLGGGGHVDAELRLPFALGPLEVKAGLSFGVFGFGITDASISMLPVLAYGIVAYPISKIGLTPYAAIGGGGNATVWGLISDPSLTGESFDGTLAFRLGAAYALPPVPKLSIIFDLSYIIVFEQDLSGNPNNGEMFNIELGVSYRILGK